MHRTSLAGALAALALLPALGGAQDTTRTARRDSTKSQALPAVKVTGRADDLVGSASSASEGHVGAADLRMRPILREGELLETVPGMIVTQHSGEGKANQYFVRGFNLDHGTDFQTRVDGMPVNMPTHGHGQGYTDLNFLMPELVDYVDYKLGVHHAELGDFGSAGGAEMHLVRTLGHPFATATGGQNGLGRLALGASNPLGGGDLLTAGEVKSYDGPWDRKERIRKLNGLARYSWGSDASRFAVTGMAYANRWNANDQIPERAVDDGLISRWGQIDSTDGGRSQRYSLSGTWEHRAGTTQDAVQLYAIRSTLSLFSDFTYFLDDPVRGDQFNQVDRRTILGAQAKRSILADAFGTSHRVTFGVQSRADLIDGLGLYHTQHRVRFATTRADRVTETGSGVYVEAESPWTSKFRSVIGARVDAYTFDVRSDNAANSGNHKAAIASPKASLAYRFSPDAELYLSGGLGFHSNDARGTTITIDPASGDPVSQVDPLVRSRGAEAGLRLALGDQLRSTVSAWMLNLDSELLFVGDAGATDASAESHRQGVTFANFYRPVSWLTVDLDLSFAHARFLGVDPGETYIPGALENVVASGVTWLPAKFPLSGSVRLRRFGSYPLIEDNSVRAHASNLVSADVAYRLGSELQVRVAMLNALNGPAEDIAYYYASRLRGDPTNGVDDVHTHPVEPRQVRVSLEYAFR